jgi:hypothetical protein
MHLGGMNIVSEVADARPRLDRVNLADGPKKRAGAKRAGANHMSDWKYAEKDPAEALALLHYFSVKKKHASGEIDVRITVQEFASAEIGALRFLAVANIELNQNIATYRPSGWGDSLTAALSECMKNLRKFEYEGPEPASSAS